MASWKLVRLKFGRTPVHLGEVGIGLEETRDRARSDTLFSGWINAYAKLFGKQGVEELIKNIFLAETPQVAISSTFLYHRQGDIYIEYLPKPLAFPKNYPIDNDLEFFKEYKKQQTLSLSIWKKWYQGTGFEQKDLNQLQPQGLTQSNTLPKVSLDRVTSASNFYHTGFTWFRYESETDYAGLYFLLRFDTPDPQWETKLHAALEFLGEEGMGGERSSGAGRFEVETWENLPQAWENIVNYSASHHCLLSLWWQNQLEDNWNQDASYELIERGGWIGSPFSGRQQRRKKVQMFSEGSVFSHVPTGQLADVTPPDFRQHQIYRNGIAVSLPIAVASSSTENN